MTVELKKKIKKPKPKKIFDKRKNNPGRPSLKKITELSPEQRNFAHLIANGGDPSRVGKLLGLTSHKIKSWLTVPLVKEEIEKWRVIYSEDEVNKWITIDQDIKFKAAMALKERIEKGKASEKLMKELLDEQLIVIGIKDNPLKDQLVIEEKKKITRTKTGGNKPKLAFDTKALTDEEEAIEAEYKEKE